MMIRSTAIALGLVLVIGLPRPSLGVAQELEAPDVVSAVEDVADQIDLLAFAMGIRIPDRAPMDVSEVNAHEVYFQALTLFQKANQLGREFSVGQVGTPVPPSPGMTRQETYALVEAAHGQLGRVLDVQGVSYPDRELAMDQATTATDAFQAIIQANRSINLLLERAYSPSEVYQQVQRSVNLAAEVMLVMSGVTPIPPPSHFEGGKRPPHVYTRLLVAFDRLGQVADAWDLEVLQLGPKAYEVAEFVTPSDVYDMATLVLSEVRYLHGMISGAREPIDTAYKPRRMPSHVYQLAGVLDRQLLDLAVHARKHPNFLKRIAAR